MSSSSCAEYFSLHYRGDRAGQGYRDLWNIAQAADLTLKEAHRAYGFAGVMHALNTDDRMEHFMTRLGAEVAYTRTGDEGLRQQLQTGLPPGDAHITPGWALQGARETQNAEYKAHQRSLGTTGASSSSAPGLQNTQLGAAGPRRPRRRRVQGAQADGGGASGAGATAVQKPKAKGKG